MFQKARTPRSLVRPQTPQTPPTEPRGDVRREDPLARMRRERDELAGRYGLGLFG